LSDLKILVINIPLLPIMAIVLALGMIRKHSMMHYMQMKR
jgi:phosphotransferase system  glucose/maltose/N-acetylglucosamine-specific IIC component